MIRFVLLAVGFASMSPAVLAAEDKVLKICIDGGTPQIRIDACNAILGEPGVPPVRAEIAHYAAGTAYFEMDDLSAAYAKFKQARQLDPESGDTHRMMGLILLINQQYADALSMLDRAVSLNPQDKEAWNHWGVAHATVGDTRKAQTGYYKALQIDPDYLVAITNRAKLFLSQGNYKRAIGDLRRGLKLAPADPGLLQLMGQARQGS